MSSLFFIFSLIVLFFFSISRSQSLTLSSRLIHRFSEEAREIAGGGGVLPPCRSPEYHKLLIRSDLQRQKKRIGNVKYQKLFPAEGSDAFSLGNDFGWLHYTWIDIGTPNVSFLVALDAGSDLLWVPCDCIQCAPLSGYRGSLVLLGVWGHLLCRIKFLACIAQQNQKLADIFLAVMNCVIWVLVAKIQSSCAPTLSITIQKIHPVLDC